MLVSLRMTKKEYIAKMHRMFAVYGFAKCPLNLQRLSWMWENNVTEERAYRIGCDVSAGYSFITSVRENR